VEKQEAGIVGPVQGQRDNLDVLIMRLPCGETDLSKQGQLREWRFKIGVAREDVQSAIGASRRG
jgi:hypothetical protein